MLYVTTRSNQDAYTAQRILRENRASDGGMYLPFRAPSFSKEDIQKLGEKSFGQNVADILNLLFQTKLTSWDVTFCIGRNPVRLTPLRHRIQVAENWHNPQGDFSWLVQKLTQQLCGSAQQSGWAPIGIRIAVLFGLFGELKKQGIDSADISVVSGDFSLPISVWYARQWGLPLRNIVCCCNENNSLWDLVCQGQMRTDAVSIPTMLPEADVTVPAELERLIHGCGGSREVELYLNICRSGSVYRPSEAVLNHLRQGLFVSVVSSERILDTIPGVYRTHRYLMSSYTALAYSGLLDYRAKTGETSHAVVISDRSASAEAETVAKALAVSEEEIKQIFD